jgi:phospholipid/cholesterol/gamma-HCH transport system permease protein
MAKSSSPSGFFAISESDKGMIVVRLRGRIDVENSASILQAIRAALSVNLPISLTVDLGNVSYLDDFGAAILLELRDFVMNRGGRFTVINNDNQTDEVLSQINFDNYKKGATVQKKKEPHFLVYFGESVLNEAANIRFMLSFIGSMVFALIHVCSHPKSLRASDTISCMEKTGVEALPIVALISFLLGLIMAFMSSIQLQQFGANIYVASLVALAMISELGPIMTAIIVAGRSGSAFAAEIGTMKISEEIDALYAMGFDTTVFLAVPRIVASVIVVPLLTLFSNLFAIAGGLTIGVFMLGLTPASYISQTIETITLFEVLWGMLKSAVFAVLISWIACFRGFQTKGGAAGVGNSSTSAVVSSIFLIILFDSIFAVIRSYWR